MTLLIPAYASNTIAWPSSSATPSRPDRKPSWLSSGKPDPSTWPSKPNQEPKSNNQEEHVHPIISASHSLQQQTLQCSPLSALFGLTGTTKKPKKPSAAEPQQPQVGPAKTATYAALRSLTRGYRHSARALSASTELLERAWRMRLSKTTLLLPGRMQCSYRCAAAMKLRNMMAFARTPRARTKCKSTRSMASTCQIHRRKGVRQMFRHRSSRRYDHNGVNNGRTARYTVHVSDCGHLHERGQLNITD